MNIVKDFLEFIRKQGVVGLTVGFILGTESSRLVSSIVDDVVNPVLGVVMGLKGKLTDKYVGFFGSKILWGDLVGQIVNFLIVALLVYFIVEKFGLIKSDEK
jgi:large conductance mechanosensitive channel